MNNARYLGIYVLLAAVPLTGTYFGLKVERSIDSFYAVAMPIFSPLKFGVLGLVQKGSSFCKTFEFRRQLFLLC
ncbi:MAG: hypothetical protein SNF33_03720 [Candidatus Algichlamydia australiensis]|nr:hypothetical protein [Chlamydiales bacterium]